MPLVKTTVDPPPRAKMLVRGPLRVEDLSPDQKSAYDAITTWLSVGTGTKKTLTLGGYAGTGKSELVALLAHRMPTSLAFCAFTGRASSVLARKLASTGIATVNRVVRQREGRPRDERPYCGTIHGLVYRPCDQCMVQEEHEHTYEPGCRLYVGSTVVPSPVEKVVGEKVECPACSPPPPVKRDGPCLRCHNARFLRRDKLDRAYRLIVVDEASMVSDDLVAVLQSYGTPVLAVGDHGQLRPVRGYGELMKSPDVRLEKIHRQAEGNPIIALSARIREGGDIDDRLEDGKRFTILAGRHLESWTKKRWRAERLGVDLLDTVMISWTNRKRVNINRGVRKQLGFEDDEGPGKGEVVVCLKNDAPIYNGMRGLLSEDARLIDPDGKAPKWWATVDFVEDGQTANLLMSHHQFFEEETIDYDRAVELGVSMAKLGKLFDFGYCLTCHKMQGSQAPDVGVVLEPGLKSQGKDDYTRWLYTAVTRASDTLTVIR